MAKDGHGGTYAMMYYSHNLQFGAAAFTMDGRYAEAMKMATELAGNAKPMLKDMPPIELALAYPSQILLRFGRWTDIIKATPPDDNWPISATAIHMARGSAFATLGNIPGPAPERKA